LNGVLGYERRGYACRCAVEVGAADAFPT